MKISVFEIIAYKTTKGFTYYVKGDATFTFRDAKLKTDFLTRDTLTIKRDISNFTGRTPHTVPAEFFIEWNEPCGALFDKIPSPFASEIPEPNWDKVNRFADSSENESKISPTSEYSDGIKT